MACISDNEAIKTAISMLSPAVAAETASFVIDTSFELYPVAMRGHPDTPATTSLREYHFTILMTQVSTAFADGRGQDFADGRLALNDLLQEEPQHQPLAARFRRLMGLWLQEEHNKRQQEKSGRQQKRKREREEMEGEKKEEREKPESSKRDKGDKGKETKTGEDRPSTLSAASQHDLEDDDKVEGLPSAPRAKSVFDPSGLVDTGDDQITGDEEEDSSSVKETARN